MYVMPLAPLIMPGSAEASVIATSGVARWKT
jgi:hypothetical protein